MQVPSYISRSVAGSYDNEAVAIFALIFTFYLYIKVTLPTQNSYLHLFYYIMITVSANCYKAMLHHHLYQYHYYKLFIYNVTNLHL